MSDIQPIGPHQRPEPNNSINQPIQNESPSAGKSTTDVNASIERIRQLQDKSMKQMPLNVTDAKALVTELSNQQLQTTFKTQILSIISNLKPSVMDSVIMDLLAILQTELGGNIADQYMMLMPLIDTINAHVQHHPTPEPAMALQRMLTHHAQTVSDPRLAITIQQVLDGMTPVDGLTVQPTPLTDMASQPPAFVDEEMHTSTVGSMPATLAGLTESFQGTLPGMPTDTPSAQALSVLNNAKTALEQLSGMMAISEAMPTFIILPIASELLVNIGAMLTVENPNKIAIVTDYVAALLEYDRLDYIRKVSIADDLSTEIYDHYKQLYDDGYRFIISLHLNKNLRKTYQSAMSAKRHMDQQAIKGFEIHVHNTNANGVGLGLMIYELIGAIKANQTPLEVNHLAIQLVQRYKHWVCPMEYDFVKNHQWAMELADNQKKIQMRLFHFIPVIELDKKLTIVSVSHSKEAALAVLIDTVCKEAATHRKITRICVEYNGVYRDALKVRNQLNVRFPSVKVSLQSVGSLTTRFFGPQLVGICII